jgi:hypothetical protein
LMQQVIVGIGAKIVNTAAQVKAVMTKGTAKPIAMTTAPVAARPMGKKVSIRCAVATEDTREICIKC